MDPTAGQRHKDQVSATYDLASGGYDKPALRFFPDTGRRLVEFAGIGAGDVVLDIATGTGAVARAAIERVGPTGSVIGIDISSEMLRVARERLSRHPNLSLHFMDAESPDFPPGSFSAVLSSFGLFFLPDMASAARNWARLVAPGGRVALSAFTDTAFQPLSDMFVEAIRPFGVDLPESRRPFSWQRLTDPERYRDLLRGAGLADTVICVEQHGYHLAGVDDWWDVVWNCGFRGPLSKLAPADLERFKSRHLADVERTRTPEGIWLDIGIILAKGSSA